MLFSMENNAFITRTISTKFGCFTIKFKETDCCEDRADRVDGCIDR